MRPELKSACSFSPAAGAIGDSLAVVAATVAGGDGGLVFCSGNERSMHIQVVIF